MGGLPARYPRAFEIVAIVLIVTIAAFLRFTELATIPPGLHGDEAITGIDGRRILAEGWIGVYSPLALGQPTGPLYLTALSLRLFGESIFALRVVSAVLGTLTVAALYLVLRRNVETPAALAGAALFAVMGWHLHFSRIAFPLAAWPLLVVLTAGVALEAARRGSPGWWAAAGGMAALGVYVYNAHPTVLASVVLFAAMALIRRDDEVHPSRGASARLVNAAAFILALGLTLLPMASFAADARNGFFQHHRTTLLFSQPVWADAANWSDRVALLAGRYRDFWNRLCCDPVLDGVDGTGLTPIVPLAFLLLAVVGLLFALRRWREPWVYFALLVVVIVPLGAVFTVEGLARRTLVVAPMLALFAGYAASVLARATATWRLVPRALVTGAMLVVTGVAVYQNLDHERRVFARSQEAAWVFAKPMADAATFMRCLRPRHHVYFLSDRWSVNYESRQFLAPDVSAEDRSAEFGEAEFGRDPEHRYPVFVLVGPYRDRLPDIRRRDPGGETFRVKGEREAGDPSFVAYFPPARAAPNRIPSRCWLLENLVP